MKAQFHRILLVTAFILTAAFAQANNTTGTVKGRVLDTQKQPVPYSTVVLLNPETREIARGSVCNENGEYNIDKVNAGEYILSVRMIGFTTDEAERVVINSKNRLIERTVVLKSSCKELSEVVIKDKTRFVEQAVDKIVINPNASITSASESVYEILKKTPGITIDNDENITLKGMQGIVVMIDDKPTYVSGKELAPLLKGMLGKNIKNIEIIENPSAHFDAAGNSGIINIKTKHNKAPGFNGNFNSGLTFTRTVGGNAGLDLNLNLGKLNIYGNYSFYEWHGWQAMKIKRRFTGEDINDTYQLGENESPSTGNSHNYKVGTDYFISKNHVVSFMAKGNTGLYNSYDQGTTAFADSYLKIDSTVTNNADQKNTWSNQTFNINYKWDIDSAGRFLLADVDYARFYNDSKSDQDNKYFDILGNDMNQNLVLHSKQKSDIDIVSAKLDYAHPINKVFFFESGFKCSFVTTNSRAIMLGYIIQDDKFNYRENIQAGYISGRANFKKTTLQIGLRLENTSSTGNSVSADQVNKDNYLQLFPSLFVQQTLNPEQTFGFRYSYRIGRPNYHYLNPAVWVLNPYVYMEGNPLLNPEFTHSISVNHSYRSMLMTSFGFNYTEDLITQVIYQNNETKIAWQTIDNLGNSIYFNLTETLQLEPYKWWRLSGTVTGMYKEVNALATGDTQFKRWSCMANMNNNFSLPYGIGMELSGKYMSKQLVGNFTMKSFYSVDIGVKRNVLKDKGVLRASFSDIFNTGSAGAYTKYGNVDIDVNNQFETQRLNVSFSYRFGKSEFKTRAGRSTASSEEEGRSSK